MKTLVILNDSPYGSERTYNGVRLAAALARQEGNEVRLFLIGGRTVDSVCLLVRDLRRGDGLSGKPASTIGFEKRFNPMLAMSREAFVDAVTAGIPPQPQDMARIVAANLRGIAPRVAYA